MVEPTPRITPAPQRLHPLSIPARMGSQLMKLVVPAVLAAFFVARDSDLGWQVIALAFIGIAALGETYLYLTTWYVLAPTEIVVRRGLVFKRERHIPLDRIQNIDLVQNPIERWLKLAEVRIQTASGKEPEAILRDLSLETVEAMRAFVFADRSPAAPGVETSDGAVDASVDGSRPAPDPGVDLVRLSTLDLVAMGLTSVRGLAVLAILFGAAWEYDLFDRLEVQDRAESWWAETDHDRALLFAPLALLAMAVVLQSFSALWTIVRFHGFRLRRTGDDLRVECGLLTRRTATVPRARIQFLSVQQTLPQRWLGRASIRVETAGGVGEKPEEALSRRWFVPWIRQADVPRVLAEAHPELAAQFDGAEDEWQRPAPRARVRVLRRCLVTGTLLGALGLLFWRPWGALAIAVVVPLLVVHGFAALRALRFARSDGGIVFRSGVLTRRLSATLFGKTQSVSLYESPFDRRHRMASVMVDTAGAGPAGHRIVVPYLERDRAQAMMDDLSRATAQAAFRWQ